MEPKTYEEQVENLATDHPIDLENAKELAAGYAPEDVQQSAQILGDPEFAQRKRRYVWKLDCIILPTVSALYFFEYLDRGNIANAKLLGLANGHDTSTKGDGPGKTPLTPVHWETALMIFYVGLILFQVPGCIGYRIFPPSKWIAFGVCSWCVVCVLQATTFNLSGLLACRFFIGTFEGLFGTGIVYYLSLWYRREELGLRVFWFLGPTAVAGAFGGLISYGVGHIHGSIPEWKLLFLIEGLPGFLLGLFCIYWLPDRPLKNSRFNAAENEIARARYHSEAFDRTGPIQRKHVIWTIKDWKLYAQAFIYLPTAALLSSISGFVPSIVQSLGYTSATSANLMTVPPYACAFTLMFITSYSSDRLRDRGIHITVLACIAAICYLCLATLGNDQLKTKYGLLCIAVSCVYSTYPPSHAWAANNFGNETKRAIGMGMYTAIGNCGAIAGSFFYPSTEGPEYRKGHWLCFGMSIATAVVAFSNSYALGVVNRHRDRKYGKPVPGMPVNVSEEADNNVMFRFIT